MKEIFNLNHHNCLNNEHDIIMHNYDIMVATKYLMKTIYKAMSK